MRFIDQLKAEVKIHGDMETDFRSRRYHQARNLAAKYVDMIEEEARIAARSGNYERIEGHALISGFCPLNEALCANGAQAALCDRKKAGKLHPDAG